MEKKKITKEERVQQLSGIIRISLMEISTMIPYMDLLEEIMDCYEDEKYRTSYDDLNECFKLYNERKSLKAFRGTVTRRIYLLGTKLKKHEN